MAEDWFQKNLQMWEQFTSQYTDMMFKTVERTMQQSQAFRGQIDKAVEAAVAAQTQATLQTLQALQRQVEALSVKIDELIKSTEQK